MINKRFSKISVMIAVVILIALVMGITTLAASNQSFGDTPTFYAKDYFVQAGDTVTVEVCVANNPGILNATLTISFDERLTLSGIEQGDALKSLEFTPPENIGEGTASSYNFLWNGIDQVDSSNGTALLLTFTVPDDADPDTVYSLDLSYVSGDISDGETNPVEFEMTDGQITVINYTPGDVNGDGKINGDDVSDLRRYITGGYGVDINPNAGDVNDDGRLNGNDVTLIRRFVAGGYDVVLKPSSKCFSHSLTHIEANAASCTEDGNIEYWHCSSCNKYYRDANGTVTVSLDNTVVKATGHSWSFPEKQCSVCEIAAPAGLYNSDGKLLKEWAELGIEIDPEIAYTTSTYLTEAQSAYTVLMGAESAYKGMTGLIIVIPEDETVIDSYAFRGCTNVAQIFVSTQTTYIGVGAFWSTGLTSFTIPSTTTGTLTKGGTDYTGTYISTHCFRYCKKLESITIPATITEVGGSAFYGCQALEEVYFPQNSEKVKLLGSSFRNCDGIILRFAVQPNLYGTDPFYESSNITIVIEGGAIAKLSGNGAANFKTAVSNIVFGKNVTSIAESAFSGCTNIASISYEGTKAEWNGIELGAGWNTDVSVKEVVCSDGNVCLHINVVDDEAVDPDCTNTGLTAGSHCDDCGAAIVAQEEIPALGHTWTFPEKQCSVCKAAAPAGLYDADGKLLKEWAELGIEINPETAYTVDTYLTEAKSAYTVLMGAESAYKDQAGLIIVVPEDETVIGNYAFRGCTNVAQIFASTQTTYIGVGAFWSTGLTSFTIPSTATGTITKSSVDYTGAYISTSCFRDCKKLASITIPDTISEVGVTAFYGCQALGEVYFPHTAAKVKLLSGSFRNCDGIILRFALQPNLFGSDPFLESDNVTIVIEGGAVAAVSGNGAASFRSQVSKIVFGKGVTSIASEAFSGCTGLKNIEFEEGIALTTISSKAFLDCTALENFTLPTGLIAINAQAFAGCDSLTELTIPASVTTIQGNAIRYCDNLETVVFEDGCQLTSLNEKAFYQNPKLVSIINIPATVVSIGNEWISGCESLTTLTFAGTVEEWNAITKGTNWNTGVLARNVICSDGTTCIHVNVTTLGAVAADCKNTGLTEGKRCEDCQTTLVEQTVTPITPHTEEEIPAKDATCTETGLTVGTKCSVCDEILVAQSIISALGHTFDNDEDTECNVCGFVREVGCEHVNVSELPAVAPTCTTTGLTAGQQCDDCGEVLTAQEEIPALNHAWSEVTYTWAADYSTCTATRTCGNDAEHVETEMVLSVYNKVAPDCTTAGSETYTATFTTNAAFEEQTYTATLDATGHTFDHLATCVTCDYKLPAGLYDANYNPITGATWAELLELGLDVSTAYTSTTYNAEGAKSGYGILNQFTEGVYLVLPDGTEENVDAVTTIGAYAFAETNLSIVYIPEGVTTIGEGAFKGSGITSIVIPESVTKYSNYMLMNCTNLTSIKLNNEIDYLNTQMIRGCTALETITIPSSVALIGNAVFKECDNLKTVIVEGTLPRVGCKPGTNSVFTAEGIHLIINAVEVEMLADGVVSGTQRYSLDKYASQFTQITISANVESIQSGIFKNFTALESLHYAKSVAEWTALNLGTAWYEGIAVSELECSDGSICLHVFDTFAQCTREGCDYRLEAGLYDADGKLLATWDELGLVVNPGTAYSATSGDATYYQTTEGSGYYVFKRAESEYVSMTGLTVVIPADQNVIGANMFRECDNVSSICVAPETTSIGQYAFAYSGIVSFVYPETVTAYQSYTFYGCKSLVNVKLNSKGKWIATQMFRGCTSLEEIVIPACVTQMGGAAFKETGIKTITFEGVIPEFRYLPSNTNNIFGGNTNLHLILTAANVAQDTALSSNYVLFSTYAAQFSKITFGAGVETIADGIFDTFTNVTEVYFEGDSADWNTANNDKLTGTGTGYVTCLGDVVKICWAHDYNVENATCTVDKTCTVCGYLAEERLNHNQTKPIPAVDATCTQTGLSEGVECAHCGEILVAQEETPIDSDNHSMVKGETTDPACGVQGYTTYTCSNGCGYSEDRDFTDALEHTEPNAEGKCDNCGMQIGHVHVYDEKSAEPTFLAQAAGCQTPARYYYNCSVEGCADFVIGETFVDENGPVLGHDMQPATCTEPSKCSREGCSAAIGSALGHLVGLDGACEREGCDVVLTAGLYTDDGTLVATWDELVAAGLDITIDYGATTDATTGHQVLTTSGWSVLKENDAYSHGTILVISDSVTRIGKFAFATCPQLKQVIIPESVTYIGERAFNNCTGLIRVELHEQLPTDTTAIYKYAFNGCTSITSVVINGKSEQGIFEGCENLTDVTFGPNAVGVSQNMFRGCTSLVEIEIPAGLTFANAVFQNCTALRRVVFGSWPTNFSSSAENGVFNGCTVGAIDIVINGNKPESVTTAWVLKNHNSYIRSVTLGAGVIGMPSNSPLAGLSVGYFTFEGTQVAWEALGVDVSGSFCYTTIGGVTTHNGHVIGSTNVCTRCGETIAAGLYDANGVLVATWAELVAAGIDVSKDYASNTDATRPMAILASQFATGTQLVLPVDETVIGAFVFAADSASTNNTLTKVIFSPNTTKLGTGLFTYSKIKTVVIPAGVTEVPAKMFNLSTVETVLFEGIATKIGDAAFRQCKYLTTLKFGDLENYEIPHGITGFNSTDDSASSGVFNTCTQMTTIIIPTSVTTIGYRTFYSGTGTALMNLETIVYKGTMAQWNAIEKQGTSNKSWDYQLTKLKRIVCSDGVICVTSALTGGRPSYGEHTYVDGVCSNCGITPCDNGEHTIVDGVCTGTCGKTACELGQHIIVDGVCTGTCGQAACVINGHSWTGEITCNTLQSCTVCGAVRGSYADHTWNKTEDTQIGDTLTCSVCGATEIYYIDTNNNLGDKLGNIPVATPETSNSELRDIAVELMKAQFSFVYKADTSKAPEPVYAYYIENLFGRANYYGQGGTNPEGVKYTIEGGSYYGGISYTGNAVGSIYRWTRFYDSVTGTMNMDPIMQSAINGDRTGFRKPQYVQWTDLNIGSAVFGNSCSSSVFWGWARFSNGMTSPWTHGWMPSKGYIPVGDYEIVYTADGAIDFASTFATANDAQTMFEAYAMMLKADGMVQDGHALMITENPVVVYNEDGTINGESSYVIIIEQAGGWMKYQNNDEEQYSRLRDKDGNIITDANGDPILYQMMPNQPGVEKSKYGEYEDQTKYVTWTFQELYNDGFLPFTTAELAGIEEVEEVVATFDHTGDTISVSEMEGLYVRSNYYISDVGFTVKDSNGKVVFTGVYADGRESVAYLKNASLSRALNSNIIYESFSYIKDQLNYFAGEGYTIEIDCVLSTGEARTVYTGTLVE